MGQEFWTACGVGVAAGVAMISANAFLMRIVIENAVSKALLKIHDQFVTKEHLGDHQRTCPHQYVKQGKQQ